ncbi:peptidoglycan-binding protein [uncultured Algimonas sp.]|uniref:peptidoglycan-binding protein n=1 Tax=uncultured Algimonas sp. TaxID=1547920 RepID=UPI00260BDEA0|nr:peptidoglycan-binding protein [uncultured Algimonas sp.]
MPSIAASPRPAKPRRRKAASSKTTRAASVQTGLDDLEARMKRADTVTRDSVESLEAVVSALETSLKKSTAAQKGWLTRHVNELTTRLDAQRSNMRKAIRAELAKAAAEGDMNGLDAAIARASARMDRAEIAQAGAVARVNKHLADIARAVDARMKASDRTRKAELDDLAETLTDRIAQARAQVEDRVAVIERDSSAAFGKVGDTIERIHTQLEDRRKMSSEEVLEKFDALTIRTQAELEAQKAELKRDLQEIEARNHAIGTGAAERAVEKSREDIRDKMTALGERVDELKRQVSANSNATQDLRQLVSDSSNSSAATAELVPMQPQTHMQVHSPMQSEASLQAQSPNFAAPAQAVSAHADASGAARLPASNPYAYTAPASNDAHEMRAFDQTPDFTSAPVVPFPGQPFVAPGSPDGAGAPPIPPFQMPQANRPVTGEVHAADYEPAPIPDNVYANPAYGETADARAERLSRGTPDSPMAVRVTDDAPKRGFALPAVSARTLRIALLATGVAVLALLAGRMILGGNDRSGPQASVGAPVQPVALRDPAVTHDPVVGTLPLTGLSPAEAPAALQTASLVETLPDAASDTRLITDAAAEPIGDYAENKPVVIDADQLETLDAAVEAGNSVAQFQKGLAELDAGRTDEGAALIRQAATANQPAALYRLAKLYEAGEGVPKDDVMARQLIERAARGGNRIAMHDLALYYTEGRGGVDLDMDAARSWFEQAAQRGVVDSQFNLAILSESSESGAEPNLDTALFWYSVAARQGDQFALSRRDALRGAIPGDRLDAIDARVAEFAPRPIDEEANGIFNDVPWIQSAQAPSRDQIRDAQTLLAALGYGVGTPDGLMGARTRSAVMEFERANGMAETGQVSAALIRRLSGVASA